MRLSMSSLAGIARTLVAVGTARLAAMLAAVRAAAPRSRICSASAAGRGPAAGAGLPLPAGAGAAGASPPGAGLVAFGSPAVAGGAGGTAGAATGAVAGGAAGVAAVA